MSGYQDIALLHSLMGLILRAVRGAGPCWPISSSPDYEDHLLLYRQAEYSRERISLETSTLFGRVGATTAALKPLVDTLAADITRKKFENA